MIAAALTAFYMARLMAMTFFGENRTGAEEQKHLHEAPAIMTVPLVVLGILSAVGGMLNLPALFGGGAKLEHWLDPVLEGAHHFFPLEMPHGQTEFILIGLAIAIAVGGLVVGWRVTMSQPIVPASQAPPEAGFWKLLYHKYYVDEIYAALIVRPLVVFSDRVLWKDLDQGMIDRGGVEGSAGLARTLGWIGTRLQTGQVGVYLTVFIVGALGIFFVVMG